MTKGTILTTASLASILLLASCGKKEPEITEADVQAAAQSAAKEAQAESEKNLESKLSAGLKGIQEKSKASLEKAKEDLQKQSDDKIAKAKEEIQAKAQAELTEKLAAQKEALTKQFQASNKTLRAQIDSLTKKFDSLKEKLPESIVKPFTEKLPQFGTSVSSLESLVSKFNPTSLEQVNEFKAKYEKELGVAKKVGSELMKLLENTEIGDTLKKIPGL